MPDNAVIVVLNPHSHKMVFESTNEMNKKKYIIQNLE